jgi:hypothetical protein
MYLRTVKVPSSNGTVNEYVRVVEAYRQDGKVKQRTIADLGRKDVLTALLPQLQRLLLGLPRTGDEPASAGEPVPADLDVLEAATWGPVLVVRALFEQLGLWQVFDELLGKAKEGPSYTDRAFVLLANRLIRPASEHGLARWLETDFVCDRQGRRFLPHWHTHQRVKVHFRQLRAWYRTLDRLVAAKSQIEVRLYQRLRDLFSLQPDLVLFDITSTYFEGAGPKDFAKAWLQPRRQVAERASRGRPGPGGGLAHRPSRLARQYPGRHHGGTCAPGLDDAFPVWPHCFRG